MMNPAPYLRGRSRCALYRAELAELDEAVDEKKYPGASSHDPVEQALNEARSSIGTRNAALKERRKSWRKRP